MRNKNVLFIISIIAIKCSASSIDWGIIEYGQDFMGSYVLGGECPSGPFAVYFQMELSPLSATLSCNNDSYFFLGLNKSWWRGVDKNDVVDYGSMVVPHDDYFSYYSDGAPIGFYDIVIGRGKTVTLAFATGDPVMNTEWDGAPYFYGWVELGYNGTDIFIVKSAIETTGIGILAGTGIVIPEPSTALLALSGMTALLLRRRRIR